MAKGSKEIPIVNYNKTVREAIREMTKKKLGIVCVKEKNGTISIITDGDLRRHSNNLYQKTISKISTKNPTWISENATGLAAVEKMNNLKITTLLVAKDGNLKKKKKNVKGILHLHDCLSKGIKNTVISLVF